MKMTVEFTSISDLANFSKFIDQRLEEEQKAKEVDHLNRQLALAEQQLERAYARLRFRNDKEEEVYKLPIDSLPIKVRTLNALIGDGLETIGDVVAANQKGGLRHVINFGKGSYGDLQEALAKTHNITIQR
jgi:DNA-directed RNA polymerase alpha subunit